MPLCRTGLFRCRTAAAGTVRPLPSRACREDQRPLLGDDDLQPRAGDRARTPDDARSRGYLQPVDVRRQPEAAQLVRAARVADLDLRTFRRIFFGFHAHYAAYNAGGIGALGMGDRRYQGCLYGAGVSYGFLWLIGKRWNLELTLGVGYARLEYDRYVRQKCGRFLGKGHENYFGPTKVGISFGFVIK